MHWKCSVFPSLQWTHPNAFSNQKKNRGKSYILSKAYTTAAFFVMFISSQQHIQNRLWERRAEGCEVRNASVCLISHLAIIWMETGTEIYTAAKLLSAVPAEAKLCSFLARMRKKKYNVRMQSIDRSEENTNLHTTLLLTCTQYSDFM